MQKPPSEIDQAIARLGRIEAVLRAQQHVELPPGAALDAGDVAVLTAALRCVREGAATFPEALGLTGKWRTRARRQALTVAIATVPATSATPWPRAVEVHHRIARHPQAPSSAAVLQANGGKLPSPAALYRIFTSPTGPENPPVRIEPP